jgi:hypothetical protein
VKLVVQDASLRRMPVRRVAERFPHVHHGQADFAAFAWSEPRKEEVHALFGAVDAAEPDGPSAYQVADHDPVGVPLANGDLVDADDRRSRCAGTTKLFAHVFHFEGLDGLPVEVEFARHIPNRRAAAAPADVEGKAFGVEGVVRQPGQLLLLHGTAPTAKHASDLDLQEHACVAAGQVADAAELAVVNASMKLTTGATGRFFWRRRKDTMRALGSPKMLRTMASGRKPGKR